MNKEVLDRIMTATAYQKKAVYALFPEEMGVHLSVIEKEIKAMAVELMEACLRDDREKGRNDGDGYETAKDNDKNNTSAGKNDRSNRLNIKKIDII